MSFNKPKAKWQFQFNDSILNQKFGPVFVAARRNGRGKWKTAEELPEHVRQYLCIEKHNRTWHFSEQYADAPTLRQILHNGGDILHWYKDAACKGLIEIEDPPKLPKPAKIPRTVPAIRNLCQLCDHFSAETPNGLNRSIYKGTDCGASISVQTPDGKWHHNGGDWSTITEIVAFKIQSIVEGSDAEVHSDVFRLPVPAASVDHWITDMEAETSRLWEEANEANSDD